MCFVLRFHELHGVRVSCFYSCDSFGFMRNGRCWESCNKRTRFGAGCFPRLPWSFSTFGRFFPRHPRRALEIAIHDPNPHKSHCLGTWFFFGLGDGGKQPEAVKKPAFFSKGTLFWYFLRGVESRIDPKVFWGWKWWNPSLWLVGILVKSFLFLEFGRDAHGMLLAVLPRSFLITWSINIQKTTDRWRAVFLIPGSFLKDQQIAFEKVVGKMSFR